MPQFEAQTHAERFLSQVIGSEIIDAIHQVLPNQRSNYPAGFAAAFEELADKAEADIELLHQLQDLEFSDKDDPRVKELVSIAIKFAVPNTLVEMSAFAGNEIGTGQLLRFLEHRKENPAEVKFSVPGDFVPHLAHMEGSERAFSIKDPSGDGSAHFLIQENFSPPLMQIVIADNAGYSEMRVEEVEGINRLLAWVAENGLDDILGVVRSIDVYSSYYREDRGAGHIFTALYKSPHSHPNFIFNFDAP